MLGIREQEEAEKVQGSNKGLRAECVASAVHLHLQAVDTIDRLALFACDDNSSRGSNMRKPTFSLY